MLAFIPINNISLGTLPAERVKNASGLYNLTRNLGGAVGLAGLTTILNDRTDLHLARLHEAVTWSRPAALEALANLAARFTATAATRRRWRSRQLNLVTHQQGVVMAFADVFFLLTLLFLGLAALAIVKEAAGRAGADHKRPGVGQVSDRNNYIATWHAPEGACLSKVGSRSAIPRRARCLA